MLEVVAPGPLLTLQDAGRPGLAHLGVPLSGPADPWGHAAANSLAGAPAGAAAIEVTLGAAVLRVVETCAVALAGADLGAELADGRLLASAAVHLLPAGSELRVPGGTGGARAYLALAGGIEAPLTLGSASTCVSAALGGFDGRPLRAGDRLVPVRRGDLGAGGRRWPSSLAPHPASRTAPLALLPGPDLRHLPAGTLEALVGGTWEVGAASDRMGIRLEAASERDEGIRGAVAAQSPGALPGGHEILSHPVIPGAVQVPADGRPVILFVDGPTIGGYPVAGVVPRAEWPRLGQLLPGDRVRFAVSDAGAARSAWRIQRRLLARAAAMIETASPG